jgi:hypothetical protein
MLPLSFPVPAQKHSTFNSVDFSNIAVGENGVVQAV